MAARMSGDRMLGLSPGARTARVPVSESTGKLSDHDRMGASLVWKARRAAASRAMPPIPTSNTLGSS